MKEETKNVIKSAGKVVGEYVGTLLKVAIVSPIVFVGTVADVLVSIACAVAYALIGDGKEVINVLDKIRCNL